MHSEVSVELAKKCTELLTAIIFKNVMENVQRFRHSINLPTFDPGNYCFVSPISNPSTWVSKKKKKDKRNPKHREDITSMSNKLYDFIKNKS